jgi:hypothetical protein
MNKRSLALTAAFLIGWLTTVLAQSTDEALQPVTKTFAFKNVTIVVKPGQIIQNGTIVIKDGLISAVGQNVAIPADARVMPADSLFVYAGFIDGLSNTGIPKPEPRPGEAQGPGQQRGQAQPGRNPGTPTNEQAGIQPELRPRDLINPKDKSIEEMRKLGFTAAQVVPNGKMLPGSSAVILLGGATADAMLVKENVALFATLSPATGGFYPNTVIGVMSKFREFYKQAEQNKAHEKMYAANPVGMERPTASRSFSALYPVIEKQQSISFLAPDLKSIYRVFALQQDLNFQLILSGVRQGWLLADQIKAKNIPVLLSLDLPKAPDKKDAKKDSTAAKDPEMVSLEKRRAEEMKNYETQAAVFAGKGITFGFSAYNAKTADIRESLRRMVKGGLKEDQALAALTTTPAEMLGVSKTMGSVEKGKMANLVVTKKPYFDEKSAVRYVFVDGMPYEYEITPTKPVDANAKVKAAGKWSYKIEIPGQQADGIFNLTDEGGKIGGTWVSSQDGQARPISAAELKGNQLTFSAVANVGGRDIPLDFELTLESAKFTGKVKAGNFGTFDVAGTRDGDPK